MQKIISLFQRNYTGDRLVRDEVVPGAEWVLAGEGTATVKIDGTACLVEDGRLFKRYDLPLTKEWANKKKQGYTGPWESWMYQAAPAGFLPAAEEPDPTTGHFPGWVLVSETDPADQWHRAAWAYHAGRQDVLAEDTYELVGPKVQGNPYQLSEHELLRHGAVELSGVPRTFMGLALYFAEHPIEGIVWHHPDGRMVKIKRRDFGLPWPPR